MASKRKLANGKYEYTIKKAGVLPKPIYQTFDTEAEGDAYVERLMRLLDKGIVPTQHEVQERITCISDLTQAYTKAKKPSENDLMAFSVVSKKWGDTPLGHVTVDWMDSWIKEQKRVEHLSPRSIRGRVSALIRAVKWGNKFGVCKIDPMALELEHGYSQYGEKDVDQVGFKIRDIERNRRLEGDEYERILAIIEQGYLPRQQGKRVIEHVDATRCLFILAVETAMRLREIYTLTVDQIDLQKRTVFLYKTKNGSSRQVPLSSVAVNVLQDYLNNDRSKNKKSMKDRVFPWWEGQQDPKGLRYLSNELSKLFNDTRVGGIFQAAGCENLHFHDLRHEATCRLYERTTLSDLQIAKITGHKDLRMLQRYANLRGSDLAKSLW